MVHTQTYIIGIDEAGRGPLAGPVAVGVFATLPEFDPELLSGIRDSKVLSAKKREEWYEKLVAIPHTKYAVSLLSARYIDACGIVLAIRVAMERCLTNLSLDPQNTQVLLDGSLRAPKEYKQQKTIIHGDATEPIIAAGAILAKVTRDRYMVDMDKQYPLYGFAKHKGYGTKEHREAIKEHGVCALHRTSFCSRILEVRGQNAKVKMTSKSSKLAHPSNKLRIH